MTESTPASNVPRYLTGDKAGLREFLAKFDVSLPRITYSTHKESQLTKMVSHYRYSYSTATVRCHDFDPFELGPRIDIPDGIL